MGCDFCTDPDGECCFPWYGLRPHIHDVPKNMGLIGSTKVDLDEPLPDNFKLDPDDPTKTMGTYTHCPKCGAC